jgi:drug/metabolite transporter (DMT)-like permease
MKGNIMESILKRDNKVQTEVSPARDNHIKFILLEVVAIASLATGGIFVKLSVLPPIGTGFYRVLFSIPLLFPFIYREARNVAKKDILMILLAGGFLAGDLALWNISFHLTTVANGNLLANLVSFTIIPVSYFVFKEKMPKNFFMGLFVVLFGVILLMSGKINPSIDNFIGDLYAFSTSIFYALFMLMVYRLRDRVGALTIMGVSAFGTCIVLFFVMLAVEGISYPQHLTELYPLIGLAIVSQICGQGLLSFCLGKVQASLSSIIVLAQPVIAAVYASLLFSEQLSSIEMLGIVITLIGIYFSKKAF